MKGEAAASLSTDINVGKKKKKTQWDEILEKAQGFGSKESAHSFFILTH